MKRGEFLKTLFLASAGVALGVSGASAGTTPKKSLNPVSKKTGILSITGYEDGGKAAVSRADSRRSTLEYDLQGMPYENVGHPKKSTTIEEIIEGLDKLAAQGLDDIVIVNTMHGMPTYHPTKELMLDNLLLNKKDKDHLHASKVYAAIGEKFKNDPRLKNTRLTVAHYSCYGETVLNAWENLPAGSVGVYLSDRDKPTYMEGWQSMFGDAFSTLHRISSDKQRNQAFIPSASPDGERKDEFVFDQKKAMAAAILSATMLVNKPVNNVGVFLRNENQSKAFQPLDCIKPFFAKYGDDEIMKQMAEHDFYFTPAKVKETLESIHGDGDDPNRDPEHSIARDRMALIVALMTIKNGDSWLKNAEDFAVEQGVQSRPKPLKP